MLLQVSTDHEKIIIWNFGNVSPEVKGKGIPIIGHEGCGCKGPHIHSHGTTE